MKKLEGKVAIVTGASKGIGAGIARAYAAEGARVVVNYATSKEGADRVVADIRANGGDAIAVQADMSKAADVKRLFAEAKQTWGRLDILVNNAAIYRFAPLEAVTEDEIQRLYGVNVIGPILAIQESLKHFGEKGGSIINVSTVASTARMAGSVVYSSSKSALDSVTRVLSAELGSRKIRVNTVSPGTVETEGFAALGALGEDLKKAVLPRAALGRMGQPDDIAGAAVFFASDDSSWITGESLAVAGGFS